MVFDPSLYQSEYRKGAASTSDFIICLLSRIEGQLETAFAKFTINECASVPHEKIVTGSDNHALAMTHAVIPTTLIGALAGKLDLYRPMNDAI